MTASRDAALLHWADALRAAALLAVDPAGLGGVVLRAQHGPVREAWLAALKGLLPPGNPMRRVPLHVRDDRLLGGLDLAATLQAGRPVAQTGLLAEADGGLLLLAMAERVGESTAARLCAALDTGELVLERDGLAGVRPARFGVVALDERTGDDPPPPARLLERLAFHVALSEVSVAEVDMLRTDGGGDPGTDDGILEARRRLPHTAVGEDVLQALCAAAMALGVDSSRAPLLALRAARAAAALDGRDTASAEDASLAARLVLAPRATRMPAPAPDAEPPQEAPEDEDPPDPEAPPEAPPEPPPPPDSPADRPETAAPETAPQPEPETPPPSTPSEPLEDVVLEAARAAIPAGLLARLAMAEAAAARIGGAGGRAGALREARLRGRPAGTRAGSPRDGGRLALIDTLRAAAPWQTLRRRASRHLAGHGPLIEVRAADLRIARLQQRTETTTIFAIDASGSAALHRLAEAKGAIELLLADCYVRRDQVAVLAFRGREAQLLLPPTRSLVRAKRSLAGLPGGGGTPLAAGIDAAAALAQATRRRGGTPIVVLLTDGRANVARDGAGGRARADEDARQSARRLRAAGFTTLLIDTSPQPQPTARVLAGELGAAYLPLPHAGASTLSRSVKAATASASAPVAAIRRRP